MNWPRQLYTERPDHAIIASTYAFALHLRGNTREGLAVLQKLKPEALEDPPVALYYGVLLSASGQAAQARKYLDLAQRDAAARGEATARIRPQGALATAAQTTKYTTHPFRVIRVFRGSISCYFPSSRLPC